MSMVESYTEQQRRIRERIGVSSTKEVGDSSTKEEGRGWTLSHDWVQPYLWGMGGLSIFLSWVIALEAPSEIGIYKVVYVFTGMLSAGVLFGLARIIERLG